MSGLERTIVTLYEREGMTIEEICLSEELEDVSVKSVLAQHSQKYRDGSGAKEMEEVRDDELSEYIEAYKMLRHSEEPHIQERVLRNLINYKKKVTDGLGANDPKKLARLMGNVGNVNVLALNTILTEIREAKQKLLAPCPDQSILDVEEVNT
jgi:hypothetical protein